MPLTLQNSEYFYLFICFDNLNVYSIFLSLKTSGSTLFRNHFHTSNAVVVLQPLRLHSFHILKFYVG